MDLDESIEVYARMRDWGHYTDAIEQLDFISRNFDINEDRILLNKAWCYYKAQNYTESYRLAKKSYKLTCGDNSKMIKEMSLKKMNIKLME